MKTFFIIPMIIVLPFFSAAQSIPTHKAVENILKNVPIGLPVEDFLKRHPEATKDATTGSRVEYVEKEHGKGIKEITYYFDGENKKLFYEVIIELDNETLRAEVGTKLFGKFNHPTIENHWVIYNGDKDFLTVGWIYDAKVIYAGNVPNTGFSTDDMFKIGTDFKKIDNRINKIKNVQYIDNEKDKPNEKENKKEEAEVKPHVNGAYSVEDYGQALTTIFDRNVKLKMAADTFLTIFPEAKLDKNTLDFRNEYTVTVNNNGLKQVQFYTTKKENKPLYEVIFEFDNADTVLRLGEMMFPNLQHPSLENHWILNIGEKKEDGQYSVSMAWVYENRLILAGNLPNTELDTDESFQLTDEFVNTYKKQQGIEPTPDKSDTEKTDDNEATSLAVNNLIAAAINGFDDNKTDLMPNKKEEYDASSFVNLGQEQAIIRKNAAGNWRLEVRFPSYTTSDEAKNTLDNTVSFYQTLEGLEYRLVKKSDLTTANGRTYIWDIQSLDDQSTGVILKWQSYPTGNGQFGIKMELGK